MTIRKGDTVTIDGTGTVYHVSLDGRYADVEMQDGSFLEDVPVTSLNVVKPVYANVNEAVRALPEGSVFTVNAFGDPNNWTQYVKVEGRGSTRRKVINSYHKSDHAVSTYGNDGDSWASGLKPEHLTVQYNPEEDR